MLPTGLISLTPTPAPLFVNRPLHLLLREKIKATGRNWLQLLPLTLQTHWSLQFPFFLFPMKRDADPLVCVLDSPSHILSSWHHELSPPPSYTHSAAFTMLQCLLSSWKTPALPCLLPFMIKLSWGVASTFMNSCSSLPVGSMQRMPDQSPNFLLLNTIPLTPQKYVSFWKIIPMKKQQTSIHSTSIYWVLTSAGNWGRNSKQVLAILEFTLGGEREPSHKQVKKWTR